MVILSIALLGMAGLLTGVMAGNAHSNKQTTATTLVQEKLEDLRRLGYSGTPASDMTSTEDYNSIASYPLFKRVTATDVDNPESNMKTVLVTVYWDSDDKSVALQTILTD